MLFDFQTLPPQERYKILLSTVVPRPIAWIVSQNVHGHLNAAPFSFFNAFGSNPAVIGIGIGSHEPAAPKTLATTSAKPASLSSTSSLRKSPSA